jgi:hypothetical protein
MIGTILACVCCTVSISLIMNKSDNTDLPPEIETARALRGIAWALIGGVLKI